MVTLSKKDVEDGHDDSDRSNTAGDGRGDVKRHGPIGVGLLRRRRSAACRSCRRSGSAAAAAAAAAVKSEIREKDLVSEK